jgi:polar amino acid transport system substrate-binding protein
MFKKTLFVLFTFVILFVVVSCDKKREQETLVFGTDPGFAPFEFYNEKGVLEGFDIDIATAIAKKAGYKAEFVPVAWAGIIPALETKKIDAIIGGMSITEERKKRVNFVDSYFSSGLSIVVNYNTDTIETLEDLVGKTIAVKIGTEAKDLADSIPDANVLVFDTNDVVYESVISGKSDAMISDTPVNDYYVKVQGQGKLKTAFVYSADDNYGIAVRKEDSKLLDSLNKALTDIRKDGEYKKISEKWFGIK